MKEITLTELKELKKQLKEVKIELSKILKEMENGSTD